MQTALHPHVPFCVWDVQGCMWAMVDMRLFKWDSGQRAAAARHALLSTACGLARILAKHAKGLTLGIVFMVMYVQALQVWEHAGWEGGCSKHRGPTALPSHPGWSLLPQFEPSSCSMLDDSNIEQDLKWQLVNLHRR